MTEAIDYILDFLKTSPTGQVTTGQRCPRMETLNASCCPVHKLIHKRVQGRFKNKIDPFHELLGLSEAQQHPSFLSVLLLQFSRHKLHPHPRVHTHTDGVLDHVSRLPSSLSKKKKKRNSHGATTTAAARGKSNAAAFGSPEITESREERKLKMFLILDLQEPRKHEFSL